MIRFFDILFSFLGILFLSPVFLFLYIAIRLESKGGGFYKQLRVGREIPGLPVSGILSANIN